MAERGEDIVALRERAAALSAVADAALQRYERTAWIKFVAVFIPVPFAVLLFRLHLDAWGYCLAGGAFLAIAGAVMALDWITVAKRDAAVAAAELSRKAYEDASRSSDR